MGQQKSLTGAFDHASHPPQLSLATITYAYTYTQYTHVRNNTLTHGHVYTIICTYMRVQNIII